MTALRADDSTDDEIMEMTRKGETATSKEPSMAAQSDEVRFEFGANWSNFLRVLDDERIEEAMRSLRTMLGVDDLRGRSFLDIGSGSGLFSLAAQRLGASPIFSFDYDQQSVACTAELKRRYAPDMREWTVERGDILDPGYLAKLGRYDVVYSWGVLHHTGKMWEALDNAAALVADGGQLFIAIYNDQEGISKRWSWVKRTHSRNRLGQLMIRALFIPFFFTRHLLRDIRKLRNPRKRYIEYKKRRGMSMLHDWYDWLGGYPFEVAKPEEILRFHRARGFVLEELITRGAHHACNQFVFRSTRGDGATDTTQPR